MFFRFYLRAKLYFRQNNLQFFDNFIPNLIGKKQKNFLKGSEKKAFFCFPLNALGGLFSLYIIKYLEEWRGEELY